MDFTPVFFPSMCDPCFPLSSKMLHIVSPACAVSPGSCKHCTHGAWMVNLRCLWKESLGTCKHIPSLEQGRVLTWVFLVSHTALSSQENASHKVAAPPSPQQRLPIISVPSCSEAEMQSQTPGCTPNQFPLSLLRLSCRNAPCVLPAT